MIVTCGLRLVWEKLLEKEGLSNDVAVIGGSRLADGFVLTASVKGSLVTHLRVSHKNFVWAFGESPLDLEMLCKADKAIVVVGKEETRSKGMDAALMKAMECDKFQGHQKILPTNAPPRLDIAKLPLISLIDHSFVEMLLCKRNVAEGLQFGCADNKKATDLLATQILDAAVSVPALRDAHRRVGYYLAIEMLADVIGLEHAPIRHVLGHATSGSRFFHEQQTTIVALMRGGEPMAFRVSDPLPLAGFLHARDAGDIKPHHLQGQITLGLVDFVVNAGKSIIEFIQNVRKLHATISIVVVAGVV